LQIPTICTASYNTQRCYAAITDTVAMHSIYIVLSC